ncbi:Hypothetical predicted protein [Mytilus galloprovincialis]|uniref:Uncharacterized protein n=1 Tax=Mytilus galloprovincialis TaxID=29158 RepID=A0A8B6GAH7_MYTGA|nr:Hypothetical predicted protein [Mytilus galloprovincialis]
MEGFPGSMHKKRHKMNLNHDKTMLDYLGVQVLTSDSDITDLITSADLLEEQEDPNNPIELIPRNVTFVIKSSLKNAI